VPLIVKGKAIGVIVLKSYDTENAYGKYERNLLETVAGYAAIALENTRAYMHLQELNIRIAQTEEFITRSAIATDFLHRVNNLGGTIPIWVNLTRQELASSGYECQRIVSYLDEIDKEMRGLLNSASELKRPIQEENIDIKLLLESIVDQVKIQHSQIVCSPIIDSDLYKVRTNYFQISSAIDNIITNALESMPRGGELSIAAINLVDETGKRWIHLKIQDTGTGIPKDIAKHIFEPFFSTKGPGRGYGLWRSKSYIEAMGGTLELDSEIGVGTTASITLPAA
jgi:signal transduction histidine kinase